MINRRAKDVSRINPAQIAINRMNPISTPSWQEPFHEIEIPAPAAALVPAFNRALDALQAQDDLVHRFLGFFFSRVLTFLHAYMLIRAHAYFNPDLSTCQYALTRAARSGRL